MFHRYPAAVTCRDQTTFSARWLASAPGRNQTRRLPVSQDKNTKGYGGEGTNNRGAETVLFEPVTWQSGRGSGKMSIVSQNTCHLSRGGCGEKRGKHRGASRYRRLHLILVGIGSIDLLCKSSPRCRRSRNGELPHHMGSSPRGSNQ